MTEFISSVHNSTIKLAGSLKQKKKRDESGLFVVEGIRLVEEAASSDWKAQSLIVTEEVVETPRVKDIIAKLKNSGCRILEVPTKVYERISETEQPQGIMLLLERRTKEISNLAINDIPCLITILDCVQDPGNVGTLVRTADAVGCDAVIMTQGCADLYSGKTLRASMGSIFHLPIYNDVSLVDITNLIQTHNITLIATSLELSNIYCKANFKESVAIVFGNEGNGVSKELLNMADLRLHIPIIGKAESLNVSAAAAVILYEAVRQRGQLSCN